MCERLEDPLPSVEKFYSVYMVLRWPEEPSGSGDTVWLMCGKFNTVNGRDLAAVPWWSSNVDQGWVAVW
jgi:hypothetical protein